MSLSLVRWSLFAAVIFYDQIAAQVIQPVSVGVPQVITIAPNSAGVRLSAAGIEPSVSFLLVQVHALHAPLRLQTVQPPSPESVSGSSVGMVTVMEAGATEAAWTVSAVVSDGIAPETRNVTAMVLVLKYGSTAPVPGGCNQVFSLQTDPNMRVVPFAAHTTVQFQWANTGTPPGGSPPSCESGAGSGRLQYDVYVNYAAERDLTVDGLFDLLRGMTTPKDIEANSKKIVSVSDDGVKKSEVGVTSQRRQGAVYAVVVTDPNHGTQASYVATATYACNFTAGECNTELEGMDIVLTVVCGALGVFLLVCGHHFLKTELAVFGFIGTTLVAFYLLSIPAAVSLSDNAALGIGAGIGLVGAVGCVGMWLWFAFPSISVVVPGLTAGYLLACTLFFTPFANLSWWDSNLNYGLIFACVALLFVVALLCSPHTLNIVSCGLVGGYLVVMVAAIPLGSSLRLLVLNSVHHLTVPGDVKLVTVAPFQIYDIVLACVWGVLLVAGASLQFRRLPKGRPPFPPPFRQGGGRGRGAAGGSVGGRGRRRRGQDSDRPHTPVPVVVDERAPLLGPGYSSQLPPPYQAAVQGPDQVPGTSLRRELNRPT